MKGQLSAEMIILVAVMLAVVAIVAVSVTSTAEKSSAAVGNTTDNILKDAEEKVANSAAAPEYAGAAHAAAIL